MANTNNIPQWKVTKFSFNTPNQAEDWKESYIRAIDYLALHIDAEHLTNPKEGGKK